MEAAVQREIHVLSRGSSNIWRSLTGNGASTGEDSYPTSSTGDSDNAPTDTT
jgi:hypothetical protein